MEILQEIASLLLKIKTKKPLVHHITNYVTVNDCANMTLAIGASPVMADDMAEVEEMVSFASSLVINIGTLNARSIESMIAAGKKAQEKGIPIVFDPVGVGATKLRTATARRIIEEVHPAVIRGNMSEIKILAGLNADIKGVDSVADKEDGEIVARQLSQKLGCVIAITGKQDIIAQGDRVCRIDNGHAILSQVTGTGCMATSLIACFCGVTSDSFAGAVAGVMVMGLAGELAKKSLQTGEGIGLFRVRLFDAVWSMTAEDLLKGGRVALSIDDKHIDYSLYLVTDRELLGGKELVTTVEQAILGGVTMVQIREKNLSTLEFFQCALLLKGITEKYGVPFIVNDRSDIALAIDADGLHIGQDDMPLPAARKLLGPNKIIGVSVATLEQALEAQAGGADYLGVGAVFPTATKDDANSVSLQVLEAIKKKVNIPIVAIGGIHENNISKVMATGVDSAAVVSAIIASHDPYVSAQKLRQLMKK